MNDIIITNIKSEVSNSFVKVLIDELAMMGNAITRDDPVADALIMFELVVIGISAVYIFISSDTLMARVITLENVIRVILLENERF